MKRHLFDHQLRIKAFPAWKHAHDAYRTIPKLSAKQFGLYQSVIDHVAGDSNIHVHYKGLKEGMFDGLRSVAKKFPDAFKKLKEHAGSRDSLVRFHKHAHAADLEAGGFTDMAKSVGKAVVSGAKSAAKGASKLASKAWETAKDAGAWLQKQGSKAAKYIADNPRKVAQLVDLVKSGVDVASAITQIGKPAVADTSGGVSEAKQKEMAALLADTDGEEESTDLDSD